MNTQLNQNISVSHLSSYIICFFKWFSCQSFNAKIFGDKNFLKNVKKKKEKLLQFSVFGLHRVIQLNIRQWWAWQEWISKANKPRTNAECSTDNPQQLNHHRWKKHTMYPNYIPNDSKQTTIAKQATAHLCGNIFQTSTACLNILRTQIVMRHDECIFFCLSEHEPQPL